MNKTDLVNVVANATEMTKKDVDAVISATLKAITDALKAYACFFIFSLEFRLNR